MSSEAHNHAHENDHGHDHEHHHKDTFITKYIFSIDHKMISKQYLITGIIMGIIGVGMSMLFRMQIAWPEESFKIFNILLGDKFAPNGVMTNEVYLALITLNMETRKIKIMLLTRRSSKHTEQKTSLT